MVFFSVHQLPQPSWVSRRWSTILLNCPAHSCSNNRASCHTDQMAFLPCAREHGKNVAVHRCRHTCAGPVQNDSFPSVQHHARAVLVLAEQSMCHGSRITVGPCGWYIPQGCCCAPCCEERMLLTCSAEQPIPWPTSTMLPERLSEDVHSQGK